MIVEQVFILSLLNEEKTKNNDGSSNRKRLISRSTWPSLFLNSTGTNVRSIDFHRSTFFIRHFNCSTIMKQFSSTFIHVFLVFMLLTSISPVRSIAIGNLCGQFGHSCFGGSSIDREKLFFISLFIQEIGENDRRSIKISTNQRKVPLTMRTDFSSIKFERFVVFLRLSVFFHRSSFSVRQEFVASTLAKTLRNSMNRRTKRARLSRSLSIEFIRHSQIKHENLQRKTKLFFLAIDRFLR